MKRKAIAAADLYVLMDRDYRALQPPGCDDCFVQLPYRVDRLDASEPNWEMPVAAACSGGCADLLHQIVTHYAELYDLRPEGGEEPAE